MKITFLGTTVLLFDDGENQILFDAHITRPSVPQLIFTKLKTDTATADRVLNDFGMNRVKAIFVSHTHHDHVMDMPYFAQKTGADVYGSLSCKNVGLGGGVNEEKLHIFSHGDEYHIGEFTVKILGSVHSKTHWYNNDLGKVIDSPLTQPAHVKKYREGNSYDFLVTHGDRKYLIRPSCNYIKNQLDGIKADVFFMGIAGIRDMTEVEKSEFFAETVAKVQPSVVVPVHWDNFMSPLYDKKYDMPSYLDDTAETVSIVKNYCDENGVEFILHQPLTTITL